MPQLLFAPTFLKFARPPVAVVAALVALGCAPGLRAQTPLCSLVFADAPSVIVLDGAAHGCLNTAAEQLHGHPGERIVLQGPVAAHVSAARQYLLSTSALPASSVLALIAPGDTRVVRVSLLPPPVVQALPMPVPKLEPIPAPKPVGIPVSKPSPPPVQIPAPKPAPMPPPKPLPSGYAGKAEHQHETPDAHVDGGGEPQTQSPAPAYPSPAASSGTVLPMPLPAPVAVSPTHGEVPQPPTAALPGPSASAAPAHAAGPATPGAAPNPGGDPYSQGEEAQRWIHLLKQGAIDFNKNPRTMVVDQTVGFVVVVHGYKDNSHSNLPGVAPQGALLVSDQMRIDLDAPLAPGEFSITPSTGAQQQVRIDGSATWEFQVTPLHETADPQTLVIHPWLIPPGNLGLQPLEDYPFTVQITVESFFHHLRRLWHEDPMKMAAYLLPGGKGFSGMGAFLTGLFGLLAALGITSRLRRRIDPPTDGPTGPTAR